jgi:hypothetical protein
MGAPPEPTKVSSPPPVSPPPAPGSPPGASSSPPAVAAHGSTSKDDTAKFEERTFLGDGPTDHGGYGGPLVRFSSFDGKGALFVGGKGGWLINHRLLIGGAGVGQALSVDAPPESVARYPQARNVEFGYGGFLAGYHIAPESRLHAVASVLLAGGGLILSNRDVESDDDRDVGHDGDGVFVMEPELALEANLARFVRLQFAVSYRFVSDVELAGLDNADASGVAGGVAFLFGDF